MIFIVQVEASITDLPMFHGLIFDTAIRLEYHIYL